VLAVNANAIPIESGITTGDTESTKEYGGDRVLRSSFASFEFNRFSAFSARISEVSAFLFRPVITHEFHP